MTEDNLLLLAGLKKNTKLLVSEIEMLEAENEKLEKRNLSLIDEINELKTEISDLTSKNEQLKIAAHLLSGLDKDGAAKKEINILIREIDKCIALLNR